MIFFLFLIVISSSFQSQGMANCNSGQVSFVNSTTGLVVCSQCYPGTNGNNFLLTRPTSSTTDALNTYSTPINVKVEYCSTALQCTDLTQSMFDFQCPLNYFCNNQGECESMFKSTAYGKPCYGSSSNCKDGLVCVSKQCKICSENGLWATQFSNNFEALFGIPLLRREPFLGYEVYCDEATGYIFQNYSATSLGLSIGLLFACLFLFLVFCVAKSISCMSKSQQSN